MKAAIWVLLSLVASSNASFTLGKIMRLGMKMAAVGAAMNAMAESNDYGGTRTVVMPEMMVGKQVSKMIKVPKIVHVPMMVSVPKIVSVPQMITITKSDPLPMAGNPAMMAPFQGGNGGYKGGGAAQQGAYNGGGGGGNGNGGGANGHGYGGGGNGRGPSPFMGFVQGMVMPNGGPMNGNGMMGNGHMNNGMMGNGAAPGYGGAGQAANGYANGNAAGGMTYMEGNGGSWRK